MALTTVRSGQGRRGPLIVGTMLEALQAIAGSHAPVHGAEGAWVWRSRPELADTSALSDSERSRVGRLLSSDKCDLLTASIVERRQLLACLLGRESADVLIAHDEMGKPFLPDFPDVFISFSDSEGLNGLALSRTGAVGIDVELVRPVGWEPMLSMMAEDNEAEVIRAAVAHEVEPIAFLRCWTAKEAILKAIGTGLKGGARRTRLPSAYITGETSCFSQEQDGLKLEVQTFQTGQLIVTRALAV